MSLQEVLVEQSIGHNELDFLMQTAVVVTATAASGRVPSEDFELQWVVGWLFP